MKKSNPRTKKAIKQTIKRLQVVARDHPWVFVRATWPDLLCYANESGPHQAIDVDNLPNHGQKGWQTIVETLKPLYQSALKDAELDKWWA